ncbi:hypothetical protein [Mycobacterium intracellulare]|uniref:hypothetical protein n=1 Tax=Mycobacterium intracellulare TaxID=1767 RepID=UPI00080B13D6|nr:hypothetical protein [Mycobacterium intracellulare]OCB22486.1 hypothetical protein A5689_17790 [Mycobacterium intracellulare subsp. yongonense]
MDIERLWSLAERAADLLPDAPGSDNVLDWMSWRELVWETAQRLGAAGGALIGAVDVPGTHEFDVNTVSALDLIQLSVKLQRAAAVDLSADASMPQPY